MRAVASTVLRPAFATSWPVVRPVPGVPAVDAPLHTTPLQPRTFVGTPRPASPVAARADHHRARRPPNRQRNAAASQAPLSSPQTVSPVPPFLPNRLQQARLRLHLLHRERQLRRVADHSVQHHQNGPFPTPVPAHSVQPTRPRQFVTTRLSARPDDSQPHAPDPARRSVPAASPTPTPSVSSSHTASQAHAPTHASAKARENEYAPDESVPPDTAAKRRAHSERMRALWRDPAWRAAMLARRARESTVTANSEALKECWRDSAFRARQRAARLGRTAWNKGVSPGKATRLRISLARQGMKMSEETKRKISAAKRDRPEGDEWPRHISESKKGKTKQYFAMRREFRALHRDLKLWSDTYRSTHGRLPSADTYERFVAPMMVFRIRRYLTLRDAMGADELDSTREIIK